MPEITRELTRYANGGPPCTISIVRDDVTRRLLRLEVINLSDRIALVRIEWPGGSHEISVNPGSTLESALPLGIILIDLVFDGSVLPTLPGLSLQCRWI